jgi:propanol-preferring alcohol dehydrogenase
MLERFGAPLRVGDSTVPKPGPGEAMVRTVGCGICRTDVHITDGLAYRPSLPHILGHEPAGTIVAIGPEVSGWAVGDRVLPYLFDACGRCAACKSGNEAQCENLAGILGVTRNGGFAEFFCVPAANLLRVPDNVDLASAGLVSCAAVTAVRATHRAALSPGDKVAVVGAGAIGLMIIQILVAAGHDVHVVNRSEEGRKAGLADGATSAMAPDALAGEGTFDRVFDLVGTAATMAVAGKLVRRMGRIVVIGEEPEFPAIDTIAIAQREIEIVGSRNGGRADAREALDLLAQGVIRPHIARRIPLSHLNDALDDMRAGKVHGRIVVEFPR